MMFEGLKRILRPPEAKASRTSQVLAFESGGRARWTPRDYAALAREGYLANAIVHRAVRLIAENAASCGFLLYEGAQEREAHPLLHLLTRPNARQDGASFFEALYAHMLLAGNAYVEAVGLGDEVRELYTLRRCAFLLLKTIPISTASSRRPCPMQAMSLTALRRRGGPLSRRQRAL
jgi:phage portal protein BeeE